MIKNSTMKLADIAKLANVSESTVSRALSNNKLINKKTRERIQAIAQEYGFKVNASARNLRLQKTNTIAVIVLLDPNSGQSISDPFLLEILGTIADELTKYNFDLLLCTSKTNANDWHRYYITSRRADGLIVIGQGEHDQRVEALASENAPFVVWGAQPNHQKYVTVGSDNRKGGYLATKHLIQQGCKQIVFLGDIHHNEIEMRWKGYQDALEEAGIPLEKNLQISTDFTSNDGYSKIRDLFLMNQYKIDGIFAVSDAIAIGAMKFLLDKDIKIPDEIAVIGFDDIALSHYSSPALSTVKQNISAGGKLLVDLLLKKLNNQPITSQLLDVELVVRQSTAKS